MKRALITGIYGQDGSYLCEQLSELGFEIYGISKNALSKNSMRIKTELNEKGYFPIDLDISLYDYESVRSEIKNIQPNEIYHMAVVNRSSENEDNTLVSAEKTLFDKNILATHNILASCFEVSKLSRVLIPGSCLMYDNSNTEIQNEKIQFKSSSLYGLGKITENNLVSYYRDKGLFSVMPILYNHESHRRSKSFVTRKIANGFKLIKDGKLRFIELGNITESKDWGFAGDYTKAMQLILRNTKPRDYIVASGELHTILEFVEGCARYYHIDDWRKYVKINNKIILRTCRGNLHGDSTKICSELNWKRQMNFNDLIEECCN